jgi:zinc-ribbon domain
VVVEAMQGQRLTIREALGHAYRRFWSLLGAGILVVLIVAVGFIALIIPGILFVTWYAYTTPAIMLENKGALAGMSASKAFGRDKKWSTITLLVVFFLVYLVVGIIGDILSLGGGGRVIQTLLTIPLSAWTSVVIAYTYISHGPSASSTTETTATGWQQPPSSPNPTWPPAGTSPTTPQAQPGRFCPYCGSPLQPDAKFCASCGRPVQ